MSDSESNSNYKSKQNNNPNLLNEYVIYCFPKDSITNNISNNIIINKWNFISCFTYYNERKAYLYINPEIESSTQIILDFYDNYEYENDYTTLSFSDDYTGINEFLHLWNEQYKNQPNVYNNPYLNDNLYTMK